MSSAIPLARESELQAARRENFAPYHHATAPLRFAAG